jgi:hypothetical protein
MRTVLVVLGLALLALVAAGLHYYLPQRDIVYITGVETPQETETVSRGGESVTISKSTREIHAVRPDGSVIVYHNSDAPWYFKWDSADLHAKASQLTSTEKDPTWTVVTHYGWRITFLSWFPNAIDIRPADGPDEELFPWLNIVLITLGIVLILVIRRFILIAFDRFTDAVGLDEK